MRNIAAYVAGLWPVWVKLGVYDGLKRGPLCSLKADVQQIQACLQLCGPRFLCKVSKNIRDFIIYESRFAPYVSIHIFYWLFEKPENCPHTFAYLN